MLRENLWNKSVADCFTEAPTDVREAVAQVLFKRREHPPLHMRDFYADLGAAKQEYATKIVDYMQQLGMDADMPVRPRPSQTTYFGQLPQ